MEASCIPFCARILLWMHVVGAVVVPPTNVTFHCHNMKNMLSWRYEEPAHDVRFKVMVLSKYSEPVTLEVEPPNMFQDLSEYSDPENDYAVYVAAVKGNNESDFAPEEGIQYSYITGSKITCNLDLPSVKVTPIDENHLHFNFTHPGVFYPTTSQRLRRKKSHDSQTTLPVFKYHIDVQNQESHSLRRQCRERECQGKVEVHGSHKSYCLNINGEMSKMSVRATQQYCSEPLVPTGTSPLAYIIPVIVVVIGFGFLIGYMVFVKKTRPSTSDPLALIFPERNHQQSHSNPRNSEYVAISVEPLSPERPSDLDLSNDSGASREEQVRRPLGVPDHENENNEAEQGEEGALAEGAGGASEDGYGQGTDLEEEPSSRAYEAHGALGEEEPSSRVYERREKIEG